MRSNKIISTLLAIMFLYGCGGSDVALPKNTKPTANAGDAQSAVTGVKVLLSGEKSFDSEQDTLVYQWSLLTVPEGSISELSTLTTSSTSFLPDIAGLYIVELIVYDGILSSEPSTVNIVVTKANEAPTAIAGDDVETFLQTTVFLNGGASFDPENTDITYNWTIISSPENSDAVINNAETQTPNFYTTTEGDYTLQLTVTDSESISSQDDIVITVKNEFTLSIQELIDNKAKWQSQNVDHYQIERLVDCDCDIAASGLRLLTTQVQDGEITLYYNAMISRTMPVPNVEYYPNTVKGMFDFIETAIVNGEEGTVSYHPEFGYPQELSYPYSSYRILFRNFINFNDVICDDIKKNYPNTKLNIIDEFTAEPISCDISIEWQNTNGDMEQIVNEDLILLDDFGVAYESILCDDSSPTLLTPEVGLVSLKIAKAGYLTKIEEYDISGEGSCGLIPKAIEVKLEPIN